MIVTALLGAGVGIGAWLTARALRPRPVPLADVLDHLARPGRPAADLGPRGGAASERLGRLVRRAVELTGADLGGRRQDLRLVGRTPERHALDKAVGLLGGVLGPSLVGFGLAVVGVGLPPGALVVFSLAAGVGGFLLPDLALRDEAERRRRAFRHALSAYLDLVNVILAGGGGTESALYAAADAGDGWAFAALRRSLERARLLNRSPWAVFEELGDDLGVAELAELAASVALAGSHGARIRRSLAAKADTLRGHQIAETEAAAEAATERMTIPVAVLLFGFLVFVAYPAVQQITTVSNTPVP